MTSAESISAAAPVARGAGGGVTGTRLLTGSVGASAAGAADGSGTADAAGASGVTGVPDGWATTVVGDPLDDATVVVVESAPARAVWRCCFAFFPFRW